MSTMDQLGVAYMVTGSYAMSVYGEIRMTRDIDIVVELTAEHVPSFFDLFKDQYYVSDVSMRRAIEHGSMFNVVNNVFGGKIDCIIRKDSDFGRVSFGRRYKESVAGVNFWNATREDLIIAKLNWARETHSEMQIRDVANLTETEHDEPYVEEWIVKLGLEDIWAEVEKWKILHQRSAR